MLTHYFFAVIILFGAAGDAASADKIIKESFGSGGQQRTYYLYVPDSVKAGNPAPLVVLLHGSGRNGLSLVERWKDLAKKEGIVLAGPDSLDTRQWNLATDGPDFIHDVVDIVSAQHPVDPRRLYLFGHSAGAGQGLMLAMLESQYFAAVAIHAGALNADAYSLADSAVRKIPIAIWVGTNDRFFPVETVNATRDFLAGRGIPVQLTTMAGHTHDYYGRASAINKQAWAFLKGQALAVDPVFTKYDIK